MTLDDQRPCDACETMTDPDLLSKCGEAPSWSFDHLICAECKDGGCPACADSREEAATNRHNDSYRWVL